MQKRFFNLVIALTLLLTLIPSVAVAAPQGQGETVYTVQKDDSLWAIAEKYLGSGATYGAIVIATNARYETDSSFAKIDNPSVIQPGWKILVPSAEEAAGLVEEWVARAPAMGGQLTVGLTDDPGGIDPHKDLRSTLPQIMWTMFDTLVYKAPDGSLAPGLATSWEVSEDGLTYTFKLRKDVKFHDGTLFNAEAVKFSFDRIVDPATESRNAINLLGPYESSEVLDDYTLRVNMKEPYGPFLDALSEVWLAPVSPTAVKKWGADFGKHLVGTGPFRFVEYIAKDHVTVERNPEYNWAPSTYKHQAPAYLDRIVFKFIPESGTRVGTLESGETDLIYGDNVPAIDLTRLKSDPKFQAYVVPQPGLAREFMLNTKKEPTDSLEIRQALNYAVDREEIIETIFMGLQTVQYGPLTPPMFGYDEAVEEVYTYDPAKAEELLEKAGWKKGPDGVQQKDGQPLKLTLIWWGSPEVPELVQSQLRKVGIDVELQILAPRAYIQACGEGEGNLCSIGGVRSDPSMLSHYFKSDATYDWSKVEDPHLDELLDEGVKTVDPKKRKAVYAEIQRVIMEKALIVGFRSVNSVWASASKVKGLVFDVRGDPIFYDVYMEK